MSGYIGSRASVVSSGAERKKTFDITGTTTSLTGLSYTVNQVHVFHNGVRLVDGTDFTATNGSSITLTSAAESGDEVVVISYAGYQVSDTVSASQGGTFSGALDVNASSATVLTVDRTGSDGTILDLKKDDSTVGSIGTTSGDFYVTKSGSNQTGIYFNELGMLPMTSGSISDNSRDIGQATYRWQDLYLSGGVYLGGVGSSNRISDYEEGTFTPFFSNSSGAAIFDASPNVEMARYTKIGDTVTASCYFTMPSSFGTTASYSGGSSLRVAGLPFTSNRSGSADFYAGTVGWIDNWNTYTGGTVQTYSNSGLTLMTVVYNNGGEMGAVLQSHVNASGSALILTITYKTA